MRTSPTATFDLPSVRQWIPHTLGPYAELVDVVLLHFVNALPPERQEQVRSALRDAGTRPEAQIVALLRECPSLHKFGQLLARDQRLDAVLRNHLQQLESMPGRHYATVYRDLEEHISAFDGVRIAPQPLAEASLAIVVPFESPHGPGVFKALKPDIKQRLDEELHNWSELGAVIEDTSATLGLPCPDYSDAFKRLHTVILREVDPSTEQRNLTAAAKALQDLPNVVVPALMPYSSERFTAMQRCTGHKITAAAHDRGTLARHAVQALVTQPIFNTAASAIFHADPHGGNLMVDHNHQLHVLDWSLAGQLTKAVREHCATMALGAFARDDTAVTVALGCLACGSVDEAAIRTVAGEAIVSLAPGTWPGPNWFCSTLDRAASAGVTFSADLMLFRKALHIVDGVTADLDPSFDLDAAVLGQAMAHSTMDAWTRAFAAPTSRHFTSHLSNLDLMRASWHLASTWSMWRTPS
jgi:ubiquinone biosynthesis protein